MGSEFLVRIDLSPSADLIFDPEKGNQLAHERPCTCAAGRKFARLGR